MEEFFEYFYTLDGKTVYEILRDALIPFFLIATLITFATTQIMKKVFQYLRKKFHWKWVSWRFYPVLAIICGIVVVGISFLIYAKSASLWFVITFGIIIGLLAIGFFNNFEVILDKLPFWQKLWMFIWKKIGLEELIPESMIITKRQERIKKKEKELKAKEKELAKKEKLLEDWEKNLQKREKKE